LTKYWRNSAAHSANSSDRRRNSPWLSGYAAPPAEPIPVAPHPLPRKDIFSLPGIRRQPRCRLENSICSKQVAFHARFAQGQPAEEIAMLQRVLPVRHPRVAVDQRLGVRAPLTARGIFRGFVDRSLRLLRSLGEFFAAGGPLS
jgi:hypothetical protein